MENIRIKYFCSSLSKKGGLRTRSDHNKQDKLQNEVRKKMKTISKNCMNEANNISAKCNELKQDRI